MIDIARLREDPEAVRENIKKKFQDHKLPLVDEALELDKQYRAAITRASELRSMRNKLSKEIGQFMREGKKEAAAENKKFWFGDREEPAEGEMAALTEQYETAQFAWKDACLFWYDIWCESHQEPEPSSTDGSGSSDFKQAETQD